MSDKTGRGFKSESSKLSASVSNVNTKDQLPRPTMETITTQKPHDLDHENRFFADNLKTTEVFGDKTLLAKNASPKKPTGYTPKQYTKVANPKDRPKGKVPAKAVPVAEVADKVEAKTEAKSEEKEEKQPEPVVSKEEQPPSPRPDLSCPKAIAKRKFYAENDPCQQATTYETAEFMDTAKDDRWKTESRTHYQNKSGLKVEKPIAGIASRAPKPASTRKHLTSGK